LASKLYICGNHLGSIEDIPQRTISIIKLADLVLCEDTRTIGRMFAELGMRDKHLISYYDHNERSRSESLKDRLINEDLQIALISEAGMPMVSDPGFHIINLFHELGLEVDAIPGPTACITALAMSGFSLESGFQFVGFWPRKNGKKQKVIESVVETKIPFVFYESPKRIVKTLLGLVDSELDVFVVKELTKKHQTYWRGSSNEVYQQLSQREHKGEFTVVIKKSK